MLKNSIRKVIVFMFMLVRTVWMLMGVLRPVFLRFSYKSWLGIALMGHSKKMWLRSSIWPHSQWGASLNPSLKRCCLVRQCPERILIMVVTCLLSMYGMLANHFLHGNELWMLMYCFPLVSRDFFHCSLCSLIRFALIIFSISSLSRSIIFGIFSPLPMFASLSAMSFPGMPEWPGIHARHIVLPFSFDSMINFLVVKVTWSIEVSIMLLVSFVTALSESEYIIAFFKFFFRITVVAS